MAYHAELSDRLRSLVSVERSEERAPSDSYVDVAVS